MPAGHSFIFFLQDKQNRFWGIDNSGGVVITANPYPLAFSPDGWQDINIKNIRNKKYWSIDRSVSLPFKYVEDGARILKHIFYTLGPEESVFQAICEQQLVYTPGVEYGYWYKLRFKGEVDLSTFDHDGAAVTANIVEEGLAKHLKANENTPQEIPLGSEYVKLDGINLAETAKYKFLDGLELLKSDTGSSFIMPMAFIERDTQTSPIAFYDSNLSTTSGSTVEQILESGKNFTFQPRWTAERLNSGGTVSVTFAGQLVFTVLQRDPTATFKLRLLKTGQTTANQDAYVLIPSSPLVVGTTYTIPFSVTLDHKPGDGLFLQWVYIMANPSAVDIKIRIEKNSYMNPSYEFRFAPTYKRFIRPQALFAELMNKVTDGEFVAETCPYFGALQNANKVFISGDEVRGGSSGTLKMSLSDFFNFFDTIDAVGIRERYGKVLFDRKAALTDTVNLVDLGTVNKQKTGFDKSLPFNELAVGWPDIKNETGVLNGKNEPNTTFTFSLGTTKTPRKYEKTSKIKVSCYDLENARIEGVQSTTTDNKVDGDVYALHITNTLVPLSGAIPAHYELDRTYNAHVTGVDEATSIFNLWFSPKNCLLRSGDYLRSLFYKCDGKKLVFKTADRNKDMTYTNGPAVIVEKADEAIGDLAAPFFLPVLLSFETEGPDGDLLDLLDDIPTRCFTWEFEGVTYTGIAVENSVNPQTNKRQVYTMLSSPANDLTQLIDYYG